MINYFPNGNLKRISASDLVRDNWGNGSPRVIFKRGDGGYRKEYSMDGELVRHLRIVNSEKEIVFNVINGVADDFRR